MHCLLVAATQAEILPLLPTLEKTGRISNACHSYRYGSLTVDVLITGVGIAAMAFNLGQHLALAQYDIAINAGIAGSLNPELVPGTVVVVTSELFPDLGAEEGDQVMSVFDLGLTGRNAIPYTDGLLRVTSPAARFPALAKVLLQWPETGGITSDTITGNQTTLERLRRNHGAGVETMEGAAFLYGCLTAAVPCIQLRAISNMVGERNRAHWKIGTAIDQLNSHLIQILDNL